MDLKGNGSLKVIKIVKHLNIHLKLNPNLSLSILLTRTVLTKILVLTHSSVQLFNQMSYLFYQEKVSISFLNFKI